jgi:hypothetical protein
MESEFAGLLAGSELMKKLVFLLEERSMKEALDVILPHIIPNNISFICIPYNGKGDLQNSIAHKMLSWKEPDVHFVIVHDKDSSDCIELKSQLKELSVKGKRPDTLVRIVCSELESWFLGDLNAVEKGFAVDLSKNRNKTIYQNPDALANAKEELKKLIPTYQQISGSQSISKYMTIGENKSKSFQVFISGVKTLCANISSRYHEVRP